MISTTYLAEAIQQGIQLLGLLGVGYGTYLLASAIFNYFSTRHADRDQGHGQSRRAALPIDTYVFPEVVLKTFTRDHPEYTAEQRDLAFRGLREYFRLHAHANGQQLGMPSLLVDQAWHSFIVCTREYEEFCRLCFGKMIHHYPDPDTQPQEMGATSIFKQDIVNTWRALEAYRRRHGEDATLKGPALLFSADSNANIQGWHWPTPALKRLAETEKDSRRRESSAGAAAAFSSGDSSASLTSSSCSSSSSSHCGGDSGSSCGGGGGCGGS